MEDYLYNKIKRLYSEKAIRNHKEVEKKKKELFEKFPEIAEKEREISKLAIENTKKIIFANDAEKEKIEKETEHSIKKIRREIKQIYKENNIPFNYLEPTYSCKYCKDTGIIEEGEKITPCKCYKQLVILEAFKSSNLNKIKFENFNTFDSSYYSDESNVEKYGSNISPRKNIEKIKESVKEFVENFDTVKESGILFSGKPGLGKTFMSNCIAREVLLKGYTVLYQTAPTLLDTIIKYKFSKNQDDSDRIYSEIYSVDLLIIDDAGTENMNNQRHEDLFELINYRLINNKKTIISTNLSIDELYVNYDERIISRILGSYKKYKFYGEDIRLKKI